MMDSEFWISAWNEGRTGFHQESFNEKLIQYFPQLKPKEGQRVLVPLCGKTKDLLWLHQLNLHVHGVELHDDAVESFFNENQLSPVSKTNDQSFSHYNFEKITLSNGDFFKLKAEESYDFIYDRASLVALPASMRGEYAEIIKRSLKKGGKCLLIVYEYDQSKMEGPPFSIDENEVRKLFGDQFNIELLESKTPSVEGSRLSSLEANLKQNVYLLGKRFS
jgi:thiopurine S-methyltransferase